MRNIIILMVLILISAANFVFAEMNKRIEHEQNAIKASRMQNVIEQQQVRERAGIVYKQIEHLAATPGLDEGVRREIFRTIRHLPYLRSHYSDTAITEPLIADLAERLANEPVTAVSLKEWNDLADRTRQ